MKLTLKFIIVFFIYTAAFAQKKKVDHATQTDSISHYLNIAYDFHVNKDLDKAVLFNKKALAIDSTAKTAYYNICLIYASTDKQLEAIDLANKALSNCTYELESFYLLQANCYSDISEFEKALPLYHKTLLITQNQSYRNVNYNLGYTYFKLHQYESAILYLKQYVEYEEKEKGNYADALFYIGTSYLELKKDTNALEYLDKAIAVQERFSYFINKAEVYSSMGRNKEAIALIDYALKKNQNNEELYHKRYQLYRALSQKDQAYTDLKKAYAINPKNGNILLDMGVMYENDNKIELSKTMYRKCIEYNTNIDGAYGNLANLYSKSETTKDSALFYYQKNIIISPKDATKYFNFGNFYKKYKQNQLATEMYLKAIELKPDLSVAYTNLSVLNVAENPKKAIEYALKSYSITPDDDSVNGLLASLYFNDNQSEKTIEFATNALRLQPAKPKNIDLLLKRGISRQMIGDYKDAQYDYLDIIAQYTSLEKKQNPMIFSNIGYCYLEDDQLDNALKYFNEAVSYKPEIDQLIGQFTVLYLQKNTAGYKKSIELAKKVEPKLRKGYNGILELEKEGYYYSSKHKAILKKILN